MKHASLVFALLLVTSHWPLVAAVEAAHVEEREGLTIAYLEGTPYEMGRQHGELLGESVRASLRQVLGYFRHYLRVPLLNAWLANWWLDRPWRQARPWIPEPYLEEMRGLAEGAQVPVRELWRLHAIPDRTYSCSSLAAWGHATADGQLIHTRNLDWNIDAGIQQHAVVFVVRPTGARAFVNVGWAGFIGVLSGINDARISIGQIGAETTEAAFDGVPMVFLMRQVVERATDVEEAARLIQQARRTVGINYLIADAKARRALALETTQRQAAVFEADDPKERAVGYARPMADCVFRADTAVDPHIRERQLASKGDPRKPGLEPPGGSAYETRYLGQAAGLSAHYGQLDAAGAIAIAKAVAPDSNVQSVLFAWPELWVANAEGTTPAARTTYRKLNLEDLFAAKP